MLKMVITDEVFQGIRAVAGGDEGIARQLCTEYMHNVEAELAAALKEQAIVSACNFKSEHRGVDGLGQCTFRVGEKLNAWLHAYCPNYVYDKTFQKQLIKDNQHLCFVPTYAKAASILVENKPWEKAA